MFLTKKAEDAFNSLLKQAKELLDGKNKFAEIIDLINQKELQKAVEKTLALDPLTERVAFYQSKEFMSLPEDERENFRNTTDQQAAVLQATEGVSDTDDKKVEDKPKEANDEDTEIDALLSDLDSEGKTDEKADSEKEALNDIPTSASIFDFLSKKAEEVVQEEKVETAEYPLEGAVKESVQHYMENGYPQNEAVDFALRDCNCSGDQHYHQVAEDAAKTAAASLNPSSLEEHTAKVQAFLDKAANYREEPTEYDRIATLAKESATAYEFLNKVANKLDEKSGKEYPGQKLFDDQKTVTIPGGFGVSPKHPGQKVLSTRQGGNAPVESNFGKPLPAQTDVYKDKEGRKEIVSIFSKDGGTFAFVQPVAVEGQTMGETANYDGFVTGAKLEQFGNPDAAGPVAEAGHKTENYLNKVYELAGKQASAKSVLSKKASTDDSLHLLETTVNDLRSSISSGAWDVVLALLGNLDKVKMDLLANAKTKSTDVNTEYSDAAKAVYDKYNPLSENYGKQADFEFHGFQKKAEQDTLTNLGGSGTASDATLDATSKQGSEKKKLTDPEFEEARKRMQEHNTAIERANGLFCFLGKTAEQTEAGKEQDYLQEIQTISPVSYDTIVQAAKNDPKSFQTVVEKEAILNLKQNHPEIETELQNFDFDALQKFLNPELTQQEQQATDEDKKNKEEKTKDKTENKTDKEDKADADVLEDLLG